MTDDIHPPVGLSSPPVRHDCRTILPHRDGGYGSTGVPDDTVAVCPMCDLAWVSVPCYESYGPVTWWRRVWWFTRRSVRRRARDLRAKDDRGRSIAGSGQRQTDKAVAPRVAPTPPKPPSPKEGTP